MSGINDGSVGHYDIQRLNLQVNGGADRAQGDRPVRASTAPCVGLS